MKILALTAYYTPEVVASLHLTDNLFEDLCHYGASIQVYTPLPTRGVSEQVRTSYKSIKFESNYDGRLIVYRFYLPQEHKNILLRILRYLVLNVALIWKALFSKADVICVASTPPTQGAMAVIIKKLKNIPVVYCVQDVFPDSLVSAGLASQGSVIWKIGRWMEDFTYKNVDKIIVVSDDIKANLLNKGVPECKLKVIYNWVDSTQVVPISRKDNILFDRFDLPRDKFYVSYAGNIRAMQNIATLVEAARILRDCQDIRFVIIGDGIKRTEIANQIAQYALDNVTLLPMQPPHESSYIYSLGDIELVSLQAGVAKAALPSKTWTIMSAARPIIAELDLDSSLAAIIDDNKIGKCVTPGADSTMAQLIIDMYNNRAELLQMGTNGRRYVETKLNRYTATQEYFNVLNTLVRGRQDV